MQQTIYHAERSDGTIVSVYAYSEEAFKLHVRKRWQHGVKHVALKDLNRQQVLAMGLSRQLEKAGL